MVATLITEVNAIHSTGYSPDGTTGLNFFTGTGASDISVNEQITSNSSRVAASGTGEPGDNDIAIRLSDLADDTVAPNTMTIGAYYSNILERLGTKSRNAIMMKNNSQMLLNYLEEQKESIAGVSLDEEATDLVRFQHAYQSAARYMAVINDMLDVLMELT